MPSSSKEICRELDLIADTIKGRKQDLEKQLLFLEKNVDLTLANPKHSKSDKYSKIAEVFFYTVQSIKDLFEQGRKQATLKAQLQSMVFRLKAVHEQENNNVHGAKDKNKQERQLRKAAIDTLEKKISAINDNTPSITLSKNAVIESLVSFINKLKSEKNISLTELPAAHVADQEILPMVNIDTFNEHFGNFFNRIKELKVVNEDTVLSLLNKTPTVRYDTLPDLDYSDFVQAEKKDTYTAEELATMHEQEQCRNQGAAAQSMVQDLRAPGGHANHNLQLTV